MELFLSFAHRCPVRAVTVGGVVVTAPRVWFGIVVLCVRLAVAIGRAL